MKNKNKKARVAAKRRVAGQPTKYRYMELLVHNKPEVAKAVGKIISASEGTKVDAIEKVIMRAASRL